MRVKAERMGGFPEWLPGEKLVEERFLSTIRRVFGLFGFVPIETPAVERTEVLVAKGGEEKEIYALRRLLAEEDASRPEMALHFDLTVPTARYVAQHFGKLTFPFKRYQMQKVWRGERPQAGRFREFYQCDIDVIGHPTLGLMHDAELPAVIDQVFAELGIGETCIRVSNRKILRGLLLHLGLAAAQHTEAMRIIDRLDKAGQAAVMQDLQQKLNLAEGQTTALLEALRPAESDAETLAWLKQQPFGELFAQGVAELEAVMQGIRCFGIAPQRCRIDLGIARGLDYYTGTVYETSLRSAPQLGSICSGGRYDDLAGHYIDKPLPGVGMSIGLTRLLSQLFALGIVQPEARVGAAVLVASMHQPATSASLAEGIAMLRELQNAGIATDLTLDDRRLAAQLKGAERKGIAVVVLAGDDERARGEVALKHLPTGRQMTCLRQDLTATVAGLLTEDKTPSSVLG